jgi:hypothetical protein
VFALPAPILLPLRGFRGQWFCVHSVLRRTRARTRRAFSLLEVTAAAALFAIVTIGITLAVGSALSSRASNAIAYRLAAELESALNELSYTSFDTLLADTFTPPSACEDSVYLGTKGSTCLTVADREFTVAWSILYANDSVSSSTEAVDALTLIASTSLPDGTTLTRTRRILAPTPGFNGESLLRVQLSGQYPLLNGPLFLVDATSPTSVVSSAPLSSHGTALFRVAPGSCTELAPCRLALAATNTWSTDGTVALSATSTIGPEAVITLVPGKVLQVGAEVFTPAKISVSLLAESDVGAKAPATVANSICLWAAFNDGLTDRLLPSCNTASSSTVVFDTYPVDATNPALRAPIPASAEIRFYVDRPNGPCPDLGQLGARLGSWEPAAVCTSWTWGVPSKLSVGTTDYDTDQVFRLPSGTSSFALTWSGALARPAAGFADRPLWVNPRTYGACTSTASCTPELTSAPEDSLCPGSLCLSSRVPTLLGPSTGSLYAKQISASTSTIDLLVVDEYGDPVEVQLVSAPQSGSLVFDGEPLSPGATFATTEGPGPETVSLVFEESSPIDMVFFKVRLMNTVQDGIKDYEIALYRTPRPWLFAYTPVSVAQASSTTVSVTLTGTDSAPADFEEVSITAPSGLTAPAVATSDALGVVSFTLSASAIVPGSYTVDLETATGRSVSIPVTVTQKAATISFVAPDVEQGASANVIVSVRDVLNNSMSNAAISFRTATSGFSPGLRTNPSGCFTDVSGSCTVSLLADLAAPAGSYTLTASSGSATFSDAFTVASVPGSLTSLPFSLTQAASGTWTLLLKDGSGAPLVGRTVSVDSAPAGLSFTNSSSVSTISGAVSFALSASASAPAGNTEVVFEVDAVPFTLSFPLSARPDSLVPPAFLSVQRGSSATTSIRVLDGNSTPVAGVSLVFDPLSGVSFTTTPSDEDGYASVIVSVSATATKGASTVSFSTVSPPIAGTFPLTIAAAPRSVAVTGSIPQGGFSSLSVSVLDSDADPVAGAGVSLSGLPPSLDVSPRSFTDSSGVAVFPVRDLSSTTLGLYYAKLTVTLDSTLRMFPASIAVVSAASVPTIPAALSAPSPLSTSPNSLTVSFAAPSNDGGSPVSSYRVYLNGSLVASPSSSPTLISALTAGTRYSLAVSACNLYGCSPISASVYADTLMDRPTNLNSTTPAPRSLAISWSNPSGTQTALTLRFKPSSSSTWTTRILTVGSTAYTLRDLDPATWYDVQIGVSNQAGVSWSLTHTTATS